jgi:hypothetical protein
VLQTSSIQHTRASRCDNADTSLTKKSECNAWSPAIVTQDDIADALSDRPREQFKPKSFAQLDKCGRSKRKQGFHCIEDEMIVEQSISAQARQPLCNCEFSNAGKTTQDNYAHSMGLGMSRLTNKAYRRDEGRRGVPASIRVEREVRRCCQRSTRRAEA